MILPVWKDIDQAGVAAHSPMLAGRLAALASNGIAKVVADIARSVETAERARELSQVDTLALRFKALDVALGVKKRADERLYTTEGVGAIRAEFSRLCGLVEAELTKMSEQSEHLKFRLQKSPHADLLEIHGPFRLLIGIRFRGDASNRATEARLICEYYRLGQMAHFGERDNPRKLAERSFAPYFGEAGQVVWASPNDYSSTSSTQQVFADVAAQIFGYLDRFSKEREK